MFLPCPSVLVREDGRSVSLLGESVLAGSCCSLEDTLHSLVRVLEVPLGEAVAMLSENPARYIIALFPVLGTEWWLGT